MTIPPDNPESAYPNNPDSSPSRFAVRQYEPEAITATLPINVIITDSNFTNGQALRCTKFVRMPFASATGMEQLNNRLFYVQQATADTFQLYDENLLPVDGSNYTPYVDGGQMTLTGPTLPIVNPSDPPPPGDPPFPPV